MESSFDDAMSDASGRTDSRALLRLAHEDLADARFLLTDDRVRAALNRAYYAAFHAAQAVLVAEGLTARSHVGVKLHFGNHFIRTGRVPPTIGATLTLAEDARTRADYDAFTEFDPMAASHLLDDVERFLASIADLLE